MQRRRWRPLTCGIVVVVVVVAGCRGNGDDDASTASDVTAAAGADGSWPSVATTMVSSGAGASEEDSAELAGPLDLAAVGQVVAGVGAGPKVIRDAVIALDVDEDGFWTAFSAVETLAAGLGGFVAASNTSSTTVEVTDDEGTVTQQELASGQVVVRVPEDRFDSARTSIAELGTVVSEQLTGQDVTAQLVDLEARVRTLSAQEDAYLALYARAGTVDEILTVERVLLDVRTQIEQLKAQQQSLEGQAAFATITVTISERIPGDTVVAEVGSDDPSILAGAWDTAAETFLRVVGVVLVVGVVGIPIALLGLVLVVALRPVLRRAQAARAARVGG